MLNSTRHLCERDKHNQTMPEKARGEAAFQPWPVQSIVMTKLMTKVPLLKMEGRNDEWCWRCWRSTDGAAAAAFQPFAVERSKRFNRAYLPRGFVLHPADYLQQWWKLSVSGFNSCAPCVYVSLRSHQPQLRRGGLVAYSEASWPVPFASTSQRPTTGPRHAGLLGDWQQRRGGHRGDYCVPVKAGKFCGLRLSPRSCGLPHNLHSHYKSAESLLGPRFAQNFMHYWVFFCLFCFLVLYFSAVTPSPPLPVTKWAFWCPSVTDASTAASPAPVICLEVDRFC